MQVLFVFLWFFHIVCSIHQEKKGFLVVAPSTLLTDSHESICVTLHNSSKAVQVSVKLIGAYTDEVLSTSSSTVDSGGCFKLFVPITEEKMAKLVVRLHSADSEISANSEQSVYLQSDPLLVVVSTDKPQYKPGQDVCFRVLTLMHTLKPYNGQIEKVWIETPNGIRVQQWKDVEVIKHGLVQLKFPLDEDTSLGQWKIKVHHTSSNVVVKTFSVKEYVPVKFEILVKPPREILPDSTTVSWNICAKYSYGEVVQGDAHIEIKLEGSKAADQPSINNAVKLHSYTGCVDFSVEGSVLGLSDSLVHPSAVHTTVTVTEKGTGVSSSAVVVTPVQNQAFDLQFHCSQYFKPGIPYKGNIMMKTMDGKPRSAVGEKIQVCVKARYHGRMDMKLLHCWNYTTDYSSQVVFALPDIQDPLNVQLITLVATATDYPLQLYPGSAEVMMLQPTVTLNVKPWFSPSHSYIDVLTRTSLACETTHMVTVYYSVPSTDTPTPTFYFLIESRGDLMKLGSLVPKDQSVIHSNEVSPDKVSLVRTWKLPVLVTHLMSPQSRITVYYVHSDGEVVAASAILAVDRCFQNRVRVRWEESQVLPRQEAHLCIRASPYSICGVSVVDRQLMFNSSQATNAAESIWDELRRFTPRKPARDERLYCANKISETESEESPPDYDLRRKRSLTMPPLEYSNHVDAITAFDDLGVLVMSNLVLETRPCVKPVTPMNSFRRSWIFSPGRVLFHRPSVVSADNLMLITRRDPVPVTAEENIQTLIRDYFPDTWIWSLVHTGREGEASVNSSSPDTITSWDTRVTCVSEREGLGVGTPTTLTVFMPFFLHIEVPYSVKRGENVTIKVIVYNYMHHSLPILLRLSSNTKLTIKPDKDAVFCVNPLSTHSHLVTISAQMAGMVNLTAEALIQPLKGCGFSDTTAKSDTVVKQLLVKNDGYLQQKSHSALICPSEGMDPSVTWEFQLPEKDNLVSGSASLQFSAVADLFGPALENLDSLVLLPMGCGEQNLAKLAPNIFVLKYMNAMAYTDKKLRETAHNNIKKGYQRQLTFRRSDGSFSAFGDTDEIGSMWLTAAVVKTLSEAKAFINVDEDMIQSSVVWVTRQQLENGCFPVVGQTFHTEIEGEETEESTTTAFSALVVANLAASGVLLPTSLRSNAEFCLAAGIASTEPYTLALTALALSRLGLADKTQQALHQLLRLAIVESDVVHWGKPDATPSENIATTSYAVLVLVEVGGSQNLLYAQKAVRWIATQRNENGGFISTYDTVVALEALTKYMTSIPPVNRTDLLVMVREDQLTKTFRLSDDNKLVQQKLTTSEVPANLTATVVGDGCAFIQGNLKYNVKRPEGGSVLVLQVSSVPVSSVDSCSVQELVLCAANRPGEVTSMALLTVSLVTGYTPDKAHLKKISHPHVKKWELDDDQVAFYLTQVDVTPICFNLLMVRQFEVDDPIPATVNLIDYYQPEISTSKSYSLKCSPIIPLDDFAMISDDPDAQSDMFEHFHNVDFELETPSGNEGPEPVYVLPPNSTTANGQKQDLDHT